ncbi:MAG TPA: hypothetical protein VKZ18_09080 [Polyangia bacterium]|nr:hypothetical protein [Polyangia bacterium]
MTRSKRGLLEWLFVFALLTTTAACGGNGAANDGGRGGSAGTAGGGKGTGSGGTAGSGATDAAPLSGDCQRLYDCCVGPAAQTAQFCTGLVAQGICDVWLQSYAMAGIQCAGGTTATGGSAGAGGGAGTGGTSDAGATAGASGHGGLDAATNGLPACSIVTRPQDPSNGSTSSTSGTCNTLPLSGGPVEPGPLLPVDAGVLGDGGTIETPVGGQILDGDYEFVGWLDNSLEGPSRRELRVFGGGTYIEWAASISGTGPGGSEVVIRYDTTVSTAGHTLTFVSYDCGNDVANGNFAYSASGDQLVFFDSDPNPPGTLFAVDTYRRTCTRP